MTKCFRHCTLMVHYHFQAIFTTIITEFYKNRAMDIRLLLAECHGSEISFDWSRKFKAGRMKKRMDGLQD